MLSGQTSSHSSAPVAGIDQAFHTPKASKQSDGRLKSQASLPGQSPPNRPAEVPMIRWNPDDDIVPASSSPPHHTPPPLKKASLSSSMNPSNSQNLSPESALVNYGEQDDLLSTAQAKTSTDQTNGEAGWKPMEGEAEADGLEATLASKESDSFVESRDKRMLDHSRQDVQLTGLLEHIKASRPAPPRSLKKGAVQGVAVRKDQHADRSSRLGALPTYRRLGRTSEPKASTPEPVASVSGLVASASGPAASTSGPTSGPAAATSGLAAATSEPVASASTQPVRHRLRSKIEVSSESNSESSPEPEPEDDETYRPLGVVVPQKRPITYGNSARASKKAKSTVGIEPVTRVFARWARDRAYYPGTIKGQIGKRVTVFYDDDQTAEVDENHLRRCELKVGDAVMDLSCRPFKDVRVVNCGDGILRKDDEIQVCGAGKEYALRVFQIKMREKHLAQMDDRKAESNELAVDAVWTQPAPRAVNGLKAVTPVRRSASTSVQSSPSRCDRRDTDLFGGLGFLITSPSQNEEQRKRKVAKRILANGGTCANEIWDFYEKPTMSDLSRGWEAIRLKSESSQLRGVFLIVIGTPTLTPKYLMALALGVPCLSANFVDEAITTVSTWGDISVCSVVDVNLDFGKLARERIGAAFYCRLDHLFISRPNALSL